MSVETDGRKTRKSTLICSEILQDYVREVICVSAEFSDWEEYSPSPSKGPSWSFSIYSWVSIETLGEILGGKLGKILYIQEASSPFVYP